MGRERIAGISISGERAHLVLFEFHKRETRLLYLEEVLREEKDELWFLRPFLSSNMRILRKVPKVSVALDIRSVILHTFPLDTTLNQQEQNEHVHWELSKLVPDYKTHDYLYDLHTLKIRAREQVADVLAVAVKQSFIFSIQKALAGAKKELSIADTSFFGAEQTLLLHYSEAKGRNVALLQADTDRAEVGIYQNGRLTNYHYLLGNGSEEIAGLLRSAAGTLPLNTIYCCGRGVTKESLGILQRVAGVPVDILNPFRFNITTSSWDEYKTMEEVKHHYAAAAGVALRRP